MRRYPAVLITAVVLYLFLAAAPVSAGGFFVWRDGHQTIRMLEHRAFLVFDDQYQNLVLSVTFEGATGDFGWLVPLPPGAQMAPVDGPLFETLEYALEKPWIASESYWMSADSPTVAAAPHREVNIDDAVLLESADKGALLGWLDRYGFVLPGDALTILDDYASRGWSLAAIRIDPGQAGAPTAPGGFSGATQPLAFRFTSDSFVLPIGIRATGGHELDVLWYILADRPLYPAPSPEVSWSAVLKPWQKVYLYASQLRVRGVRGRPVILPEHLGRYFRQGDHQTDHLWLARFRAVPGTKDMADLVFVDPDPALILQSADLRERVEMIGYLGTTCPNNTFALLLDFITGRPAPSEADCEPHRHRHHEGLRPSQDLRTAIWALGELGIPDPRVLDTLRDWLTVQPLPYRLDALEALHRLDGPAAAAAALDIVMLDRSIIETDRCMLDLYRTARDVIISDGQADLLPRLRKHRGGFGALDELEAEHADIGLHDLMFWADAIVMAAACGDADAQAEVFQWLRDDAASWLGSLSDGDAIASTESTEHYPNELHPLTRLATGAGGGRLGQPRHHRVTSALLPPLAGRPEVLGMVLRRVADLDTLPTLARAFVLASLSEPDREDHARLRRLWTAARQTPRRVTVVIQRPEPQGRCPQEAEFDLDASSVVYAMAQLGLSDDVWSCWHRVPWSEPQLKGEILAALSRAHRFDHPPGHLLDAAVDYLRRVWNHQLAAYLGADCFDSKGRQAPGQWPYEAAHDIPHRQEAVAGIIRRFPLESTWRLLADVTLEPDVRLYWLSRSWDRLRRDDPAQLRLRLRAIRRRLRDPNLELLCEQLEARLAG